MANIYRKKNNFIARVVSCHSVALDFHCLGCYSGHWTDFSGFVAENHHLSGSGSGSDPWEDHYIDHFDQQEHYHRWWDSFDTHTSCGNSVDGPGNILNVDLQEIVSKQLIIKSLTLPVLAIVPILTIVPVLVTTTAVLITTTTITTAPTTRVGIATIVKRILAV